MASLRELARARWLRRTALALVLPLPLWILLCNLLLWTGAIEAIVTRDGVYTHVRLEHGRAWMGWPTRVHVRDASLEIDAYSYQLAVELDDGIIELRLVDLFDRRVRFERLEGTGVRVQYRAKVDPDEADDPDLAAYAPFDGTPPQVQSTEPKPLPPPGKAWGVDLDDVDADIELAWIDEFDLEPCGHVRGAMHWTDGGALSMPTTTVALEQATLWLGPHEALRGLDGELVATIAPFETAEVVPHEIPRYLSFRYQGGGELVDPAAFSIWWPAVADHLMAAPGSIAIDVEAQNGELVPGSRIHHRSASVRFAASSWVVTAAPELAIEVGARGNPRVHVWLRDATLHGKGELARTDELRGRLTVDHGDMTRPWSIAQVQAESAEIVADDLRRLSRTLGARDVQIERGRAHGYVAAEIVGDAPPQARFDVTVDDGVLRSGDVRVRADTRSRGRILYTDEGELVADQLVLRSGGVTVSSPNGTSENTWVRLHHGSVRVADDRVVVETRGEIEDARAAIVHLTRLDGFLDAVPDLQRQLAIDIHGKVSIVGDAVEIEVIDAEQLGLHVAALWRTRDEHWRLALLASGLTALGFTAADDEKVPRPTVLVGKAWYRDRQSWARKL